MPEEKQDVYTRITNRIIASLEQGVRPWIQPWNAEHAAGKITRPLRHNGQAYSGINILMLWASAMEQGFAAPIWMTFKQALELGAHVRKGEKSSLVVYAKAITRTEHDDATGEDVEREIPFLKGYTVFNVEQIEGLPALYYAKAESKLSSVERIARCEEFFANTKAAIVYGGGRAFPCPFNDNCVEDLDLKQAFKLAVEEALSLIDGGLDDGVVIALEWDLWPVCLKEVLVNAKPRAEYFESCFESLDGIFLGRLIEAFVIDTTHAQDNPQIGTFGEENFIIPEAVQVDIGVECSRFLPRLHDSIQAQHQRTSTAAISCFAAS